MALELAALDPKELILVVVALLGLIPVLMLNISKSKLFVAGYGMLVLGAVVTNVEHLLLGDALNLVEHAGGLMGSGVLFAAAAYYRRRNIVMEGE